MTQQLNSNGLLKIYVHTKTGTQMIIAALLIIASKCNSPKCPQTEEWINKMWYSHRMKYYSAVKMNEALIHATT